MLTVLRRGEEEEEEGVKGVDWSGGSGREWKGVNG